MFEYLNGKIEYKKDNYYVVDVGGVGYKVFSSQLGLENVRVGQVEMVYIYNVIREDTFDLYGFLSLEERHMFEMLISISGVGPKAALSVLSILEPSALALAIVTNDGSAISKASGIGTKTAARICLELSNKISNESLDIGINVVGSMKASAPTSEAEMALLALGFGGNDIRNVLKNIEGNSTDEIIRKALILLGK